MRVAACVLLAGVVALAEGTGAIEGRVLDADGNGVAGRSVVACRRDAPGTAPHVVVTETKGRYRLDGLAPGVYAVGVLAAADRSLQREADDELEKSMRRIRLRLWALMGAHPRGLVAVVATRTAERDLRVPRRVSVTVRATMRGRPWAGAPFELLGPGELHDELPEPGYSGRKRAVTDGEGRASFDGLVAGRYELSSREGPWALGHGTFRLDGPASAELPVAIGANRVRLRLLDSRGAPVTRIEPRLESADDAGRGVRMKLGMDAGELASEDGCYEIPWVPEGRFRALVIAGTAHAASEPFEVRGDAPVPEVVLRLPPTGHLVVRVVTRAGAPVRDATVMLADARRGFPRYARERHRGGEIVFEHLEVGGWLVELLDHKVSRRVEILAGREAHVELVVPR